MSTANISENSESRFSRQPKGARDGLKMIRGRLEVHRKGFVSAYGHFYAWGIEVVESEKLRSLFLPRLKGAAKKILEKDPHFAESQLKHYGIETNGDVVLDAISAPLYLRTMLEKGKVRAYSLFQVNICSASWLT